MAVLRQSLTKWSWRCLGEQVPALKVLTNVRYSKVTLREIGVMFCGLDYAAVSHRFVGFKGGQKRIRN